MQRTKLNALNVLIKSLCGQISQATQIPKADLDDIGERFVGEMIWENLNYEFQPLSDAASARSFLAMMGRVFFEALVAHNFDMSHGLSRDKYDCILSYPYICDITKTVMLMDTPMGFDSCLNPANIKKSHLKIRFL